MKTKINLEVNNKGTEVLIEPSWSLAYVLREVLGLYGTKVGCEEGECGSCTVLVDGKPAKSCIYPAMKAVNKEIITIEGLKGPDGGLHPLQHAFMEHFAVQCGYCTPGMILVSKALLDENPHPSEEEIKEWLVGNLCRCTGYKPIIEAILSVASKAK